MAANILLVRFSSIGDLILTTPLLRAIRGRHPDAQLTFVVREDLADTLRHNPRINHLVTWRKGTPLTDLARRLRHEQWTHRLDLHGSMRSRLLRHLVGGRWTGYSKHRLRRSLLIASHTRWGGELGPVAERYFEAARDLDVSPDGDPAEFFVAAEAEQFARVFLAGRGLGASRPMIALAPGAAHFTKRWPLRHWSDLAHRIADSHDVVVVGGPSDRETADAIVAAATATRAGSAASAAGQVSLEGTAALLARASRVVAGDTGVLHLATAVGTPVVGIYGPTVRQFGFHPYRAKSVIVERQMACRPCSAQGGAVCPLGHHRCLELITAPGVIEALGSVGE